MLMILPLLAEISRNCKIGFRRICAKAKFYLDDVSEYILPSSLTL